MPDQFRAPLLRAFNWTIWSFKSIARKLKFYGLRPAHFVGAYHCPVCDNSVRWFDPLPSVYTEELRRHGYKYTPDDAETCNVESYSCPLCEAADRDRLNALYLENLFRDITPSDTVRLVDFAPTPCLSTFIRKLIAKSPHKFSYRTADLFMNGVDDRIDIMDMKLYADNSVDFFICSHVLEHVTDDKKALVELYRILKHCGRGILVVPIALKADEIDEDPSVTDEAERCRRFGQFDHVRQYSKKGFLSRIKQAGFEVSQLGVEHFGAETFRRHGITNRSVVYIVEKK